MSQKKQTEPRAPAVCTFSALHWPYCVVPAISASRLGRAVLLGGKGIIEPLRSPYPWPYGYVARYKLSDDS